MQSSSNPIIALPITETIHRYTLRQHRTRLHILRVSQRFLQFLLVLICLLAISLPIAPIRATGTIHYAAPTAIGSGDCSDWSNACTLQTALTVATAGDQIWVKAGVYKPGDLRTDSFVLKSGVALYGGFAGSERTLVERNWIINVTVLSGDIDNNDITNVNGVVTTTTNIVGMNAYHVVRATNVDNSAMLDGFVITGGQADASTPPHSDGGGIYNASSSPTLMNVTFSGNFANNDGGGMFNFNNSNPTLINVLFSGNRAGDGGGISNGVNSSPLLVNVTLSNNTADNGAGMFNYTRSSPTLINVTFGGNTALNTDPYAGRIVFNDNQSNPILRNVIIWNNTMAQSDSIVSYNSSTPSISFSNVQGCGDSSSWASVCGTDGGNNIDADPQFVSVAAGDLRLQSSSPAIDTGNGAFVPSGVITDLEGKPRTQDGNGDSNAIVDMGAYEYDITLPTIIAITRGDSNPTNAASVTFIVSFSEAVISVDAGDFTAMMTGGITDAGVSVVRGIDGVSGVGGSWVIYRVTVSTGSGDGTLRLDLPSGASITDLAGNALGRLPYMTGEAYTIDKTAPTVSLSSTLPDPTDVSPIPVTVTFSEPVTGFTVSDVSVSNGTISNFTGSSAGYAFDLIPTAQGLIVVTISANAAQDAAGNGNLSGTFSRVYQPTTPSPVQQIYLPLVMRAGQPDLIIASIDIIPNQTTFAAGQPVEIRVTVKNDGDAPAGPFWVDLYINPDRPPQINDLWHNRCTLHPCFGVAWGITQVLQPGEQIILSTHGGYDPLVTYWHGWLAHGTTTIYALADSWNTVGTSGAVLEADETNNRRVLDGLMVSGINPPAPPWMPPHLINPAQTSLLPERPLRHEP